MSFNPEADGVDMFEDYASLRASQQKEEKLSRLRNLAVEQQEAIEPPNPATVAFEAPEPPPQETDLLDKAGAVASDVATGVFREGTEAVFNGVRESIFDTMSTINDVGTAMDTAMTAAGLPSMGNEFSRKNRQAMMDLVAGFNEKDESTVTGTMIREITNFSVGFIGVSGKMKGAKWTKELAEATSERFAGNAVNMLAGAASEFVMIDTAEQDLNSLLEEYPVLRNPVTEFMAGDSDDLALEKRFRSALVGAGVGAVVDTFLGAAKALRAGIRSKVTVNRARKKLAAESMQDALGAGGDDLLPRVGADDIRLSEFGDEESLVRPSTKAAARKLEKAQEEILAIDPDIDPATLRQRAQAAIEGGADELEINFDRINTPEDVEQLINDVTTLTADSVDSARRGVRSNEVTEEAADALGMGIDDVLTRRRGEALNAEQTTAYRKVWVSAAEMVEGLAREARNNPSTAANFKFRKGLAVFNAINQSMLGARAEAGRALQAWNIKVAGDTERAALLGSLVDQAGGEKVTAKLAEKFLHAVDSGQTPGQLNALTKRGIIARTIDAVNESAVIGLLWKPATHMGNLASNSIRIATSLGERAVGSRIGREMMTQDGVIVGEAMAQMQGTMGAIRAALKRGADYEDLLTRTNQSVARAGQKVDVRMNAISAEAFGLDESHGLGRMVEVVGNAVRAPADALEKADDFFKVVAYAGEVEAQAFRKATREGAAEGWDEHRIASRMAELIETPPESVRLDAGNKALYDTFTQQPGKVGQALMGIRDVVPGSVYVFPFVRTPINVMRYNFEFSPLAPLVGQWRADIAKGGAARDIAMGRLAIGTMVTALAADWAWEGHLQGPLSEKRGVADTQREVGILPDSLQVAGHSVRLNRIDPVGMHFSTMAKLDEVLKTRQIEEEDMPEVSRIMAGLAVAMSSAVMDKTFLTGLSRLTDVIQDPERRGPRFAQETFQMLMPFSSAIDVATAATTESRADVASMYDALLEMTIVLEDRLPRKRNKWGEEIPLSFWDQINPTQTRKIETEPIDEAILQEQVNITRIHRQATFGGVDIDFTQYPDVYDTYVRLAGNELKIRGRGTKDQLNWMVKSDPRYKTWSPGPEGRRADEIRGVVRRYREFAQNEILRDPGRKYQSEEFVRFRNYVSKERKRLAGLQRPSLENMSQ